MRASRFTQNFRLRAHPPPQMHPRGADGVSASSGQPVMPVANPAQGMRELAAIPLLTAAERKTHFAEQLSLGVRRSLDIWLESFCDRGVGFTGLSQSCDGLAAVSCPKPTAESRLRSLSNETRPEADSGCT